MSDIYTQYELTKPEPSGGDARRGGFMTQEIVAEWVAAGWSILRHYPNAKLVKHKDGHLVEYQP